jgi:predicted amidohydrolase
VIVALASPRVAASVDEALARVEHFVSEAAAHGAQVVCFPEAYVPGLRGLDFEVPPFGREQQDGALDSVARWARREGIAVILGMEKVSDAGRQIAAWVVDEGGEVLGCQTKNQLAPTEDPYYVPGTTRQVFEVAGVKVGIAICHEGWRYPETVRWAAVRGARIVFHPQHTGSNRDGTVPTEWGGPAGPYYEKAMLMRSVENTIYFASVNYALRFPESATSLIDPSGRCQAYLPYGQEGVLVESIDVEKATGLLASRFAPERYREPEGPTRTSR